MPVRFTVAEHERVWDSTPEALADIAALFTDRRPGSRSTQQPGGGHNLSLGLAAAQYHRVCCRSSSECITAEAKNEEAG